MQGVSGSESAIYVCLRPELSKITTVYAVINLGSAGVLQNGRVQGHLCAYVTYRAIPGTCLKQSCVRYDKPPKKRQNKKRSLTFSYFTQRD